MRHALIIGRSRSAAEEIENRLWSAGYHSLIHVLDAPEAWAMLPTIKPSLIVLMSEAAQTIPPEDLYRMSNMARTPVLVATGDPHKALACLGEGVSLSGPYPMSAIRLAAADASSEKPAIARAA